MSGFFSMACTVLLLSLFAGAIGYATFLENERGTEVARAAIYNAVWFELLLALLGVNLVGGLVRYRVMNRRRWSGVLFHLSFLCIVAGAAVTRYTGFEGMMHIRQGETSDEITTEHSSLALVAEAQGGQAEKTSAMELKEGVEYQENISVAGKEISVSLEEMLPRAMETIVLDEGGVPAISLLVMGGMKQVSEVILMQGESVELEGMQFGFMPETDSVDVLFAMRGEELLLRSAMPLMKSSMMDTGVNAAIEPGAESVAEKKIMYRNDRLLFVVKAFLPRAAKNLTRAAESMKEGSAMAGGRNAYVFRVTDGRMERRIHLFENEGGAMSSAQCVIDGVTVKLSYGRLPHRLPFEITLKQFELERYPGSNSPSSYASEITVKDKESGQEMPFRIYMNNILNYRGYRFFQSSYDEDEMGTVLSVNHDYWGTAITYAGYLLLLVGMLFTLFNKESRFRTVMRLSKEARLKHKAAKTALLIAVAGLSLTARAGGTTTTRDEHVAQLNSLLIQDEAQGRIEPFNTFAADLLRKLTKKSSYQNRSAAEVILGMSADPGQWKNEPLIKVGNKQLAQELGAVNEFVSFNQLFDFDNEGQYRLSTQVEAVYQKEQNSRNKYDKEVVNVDERVNICYQIFEGKMFNLFPVKGDARAKWRAATVGQPENKPATCCPMGDMGAGEGAMPEGMPADMPAEMREKLSHRCPHAGGMTSTPPDEQTTLLTNYLTAWRNAGKSGDWAEAGIALSQIKKYQQENGGGILPSEQKIKLEILYNELDLFGKLALIYVVLGAVLLILHVVSLFGQSRAAERYAEKSFWLMLVVFLVYTAGLVLRWYISDHAPWSNSYETMLFVGWASGLSGLLFAGRSPVTLAITALLSAIALFVAGMSWMNPEITNLVPVLKSYWLIVHVAVITSSYGFFAMAALLGLFNLSLMIARTPVNRTRLSDNIRGIGYIIEMALTIGLMLLTVGSFIGGVWANESWGRYWGWDPKETWALVSILVYTIILHLRLIPRANNALVLNVMSVLGFSTIVMTFFGVNYYLSGMHSYGQGTPPPVPVAVYLIVVAIIVVVALAVWSEWRDKKPHNK